MDAAECYCGMEHSMTTITHTIDGATQVTGLPRTTIYALLGEGKLLAKKVGRRTLITHESIQAYLDSLPPAQFRTPAKAA